MKKDEQKNKLRKKKRNQRRLFSLLVFVLLLIYLPALWNWLFSVNVEIGVIKTATLEMKVPMKGMFIRNEQLLGSPGDGIIIPSVQYGDKVAAYNEVASFINDDMREVVQNYREMEVEILKRVVSKYDSSIGSEREIWENAIEKQIEKLTDFTNMGNLNHVSTVRNSIDQVLEGRARYMLKSSNTQEKKELDQLQASIDKSVTRIKAPASGVVSYYCDGMETSITPDKRDEISIVAIDLAVSKDASNDKWITPSEIFAKKDQNFAKLVTNDEAWFVFYLEQEEGKNLSIQFEKHKLNNQEMKLEAEVEGLHERLPIMIEKVVEVAGDKYMVTSRMNKYIELTMDMRGVAGNLILRSVTGMKVPIKSLTGENQVDQTADIIVVEMNKAAYKRVQIVAKQDAYAIIDNINAMEQEKCVNVYDIYVVNPKNIEEGQVIEK